MTAAETGLARVEELLDALEASATPEVLVLVRELIARLLEAHGAGLAAVLAAATAAGADPAQDLLEDPLVCDLLLLHGLHPEPIETRAARAIERLRVDLGAAAQGLTLIGADEEALEVSLPGATHEVAEVIAERLSRAVPDAGPVAIAELPRRRLLPVMPR